MALRETIEILALDFAHELLALVTSAPVSELAELERPPRARPRAVHRGNASGAAPDEPRPDPAPPVEPASEPDLPKPDAPALAYDPAPPEPTHLEPSPLTPTSPSPALAPELPAADRRLAALPFHRDNRIVVPPEKRGMEVDNIQLTVRLYGLLDRLHYVVLGDLDGRSFAELGQHRGMGPACQRHLHEALAPLGFVVPPPLVKHHREADAAAAPSGDIARGTVSAPSEERADPTRRNNQRTRTPEQRAADDAALLASGEPQAALSEIAGMLGVSAKVLRWAVHREGAPLVRYLSSPRPVRYCIADVRAAVEAARPDIEARRKRAEEMEAAERARAEAARAAKAVAPRPPRKKARVPAPARPRAVAPAPASATRAKQSGPEVLVVRRPGSR